jgi:hypothetical protein
MSACIKLRGLYMKKKSIWLIVILVVLVAMFAFTRVSRGQYNPNTSRELQMKNSEINAHNTERRQYDNRPSNTKIDPSYEKYLNSKSDRLDKERNQIIERGFRERDSRRGR